MAIFAFHKPEGISSHSPDPWKLGFVEYLSLYLDKKLWLCHRLDKTTSGIQLFTDNKDECAEISQLFESREIQKTYLFISSSALNEDKIIIKSNIQKKNKNFLSTNDNPNAETEFHFLNKIGKYFLYRALPKTGKTHQIRIHARDAGIPILGDETYNGDHANRIYLHSESISFNYKDEFFRFESKIPYSFEKLFSEEKYQKYISALDRRIEFYQKNDFIPIQTNSNSPQQCLRLIHKEDQYLTCDLVGSKLWFSDFHEQDRSEFVHNLFLEIKDDLNLEAYVYRKMLNRGQDPSTKLRQYENIESTWIAKENNCNIVFKADQGQSNGLFLDQRNNRSFISSICNEKSVLNLFCYTAGFSAIAAINGAKEVVSVDTSATTLEWAKENFKANDLNPENYEFWKADARQFIQSCAKRNRKFDIIICDPPSFARSKKAIFKIDKEIEFLIKGLCDILKAEGILLFSTNFEKWNQQSFQRICKDLANKLKLDLLNPPMAGLDFEFPDQNPILKSCIFQKNS